MRKDLLTTSEALTLRANAQAGEATNVEIFELVRGLYPDANFPTIYTALVRMTLKGYLTARTGDPQPTRSGRARKFYKLTARGEEALEATEEILGAMMALRKPLLQRKEPLAV
jgi:PadR family transcriptional regulator, regulatory protein PadR